MAKQTENFGFVKPEADEFYDVGVQNENWDTLDELLKNTLGELDTSLDEKLNKINASLDEVQMFVGNNSEFIYGVEVDFRNKTFTRLAGAANKTPGADFDSIKAFGGRKRCMLSDDGNVAAYYGDAGYTEEGHLRQDITGVNGLAYLSGETMQVMVEQPKFYYKVVPIELEKNVGGKGFHIRKVRYYVSDSEKDGFKVHPAFIQNGVEKDFIYLAAYEGCFYNKSSNAYFIMDDQNNDNSNFASAYYLSSIAGVKPASGVSRRINRQSAAKRGTGWSQMTIQSMSATQMLFLIEYASFNMQTAIGEGITNKTGDADNSSELTGATSGLGNTSGIAYSSQEGSKTYNAMSYRGEENFFGNINAWVDGINIYNYSEGSIYITDHDFTDDVKLDYKDAGITIAGKAGYVSAFGYDENFDWLFIPSECTGTTTLPVGDYFYQAKAQSKWTIVAFGGEWGSGTMAGGFHLNMTQTSVNRGNYLGARLLYIPQ